MIVVLERMKYHLLVNTIFSSSKNKNAFLLKDILFKFFLNMKINPKNNSEDITNLNNYLSFKDIDDK